VKLLSLFGLAWFMLTALFVSTRLLVLSSRTRKLPELLLGLAVLFIGFLAFAVGTAGKLLLVGTPAMRGVLTIVGLFIECSGQLALVAFSWRVFHPRDGLASAFAGLLALFILGAFLGEIFSGQYLRYTDSLPSVGVFVPLGQIARGSAPAWMSFECFRFHRQLRRRLAIGLAEPMVVNRVLLWGIGIGASAVGYAFTTVHRLVYGLGLKEHVWALSIVSALGMVSAICLGTAFFPPSAYRRWVEERRAPRA
jgi:hypothetical protein